MIKFKTKQVIDVSDWDALVKKTYGRPYDFQQQDDSQDRGLRFVTVPYKAFDYKNDTVPEEINGAEMGVSFAAWLARDPGEWNGDPEDASNLDMFWERNFYPELQMVANDLHSKGLLPEGEYTINIDW